MVSVIIPVYNAEESIEKCLNSVQNQTVKEPFEIILINDGSSDKSQMKIEKFIEENPALKIQLINQSNAGVSNARNAGLKKARGEFIALLDADDEWLPDKIKQQIDVFKKHKEVDLLGTARNGNKILWPYASDSRNLCEVTLKKLLIRNELQPSTVIFRRKVLENTGFFEEGRRYAEDVDFWMRATEKNRLFILNENLVIAGQGKRSFGVAGLSANLGEMQKGFLKNIKKLYKKKRINTPEFFFYSFLQRGKYIVLRLRSLF